MQGVHFELKMVQPPCFGGVQNVMSRSGVSHGLLSGESGRKIGRGGMLLPVEARNAFFARDFPAIVDFLQPFDHKPSNS
jgi:hypothetical protein